MKSVSILLIVLTLIALPVAAQTKGNVGDREAIKSIALKWQDSWNGHDWKALSALVAEDVDFITVAGNWRKSRKEFEEHHANKRHEMQYKESVWTTNNTEVKFIRPDVVFGAYAAALPRVRAWVDDTFPRTEGEPPAARRRAVNAKAFDLLRGLLPAASLSHMGIYASGQAYEQLILHLMADPLPEARAYGQMILDAIKATMPSFVSRVDRPERGGEWVGYLERRREATERWVARLGLDRREPAPEDRPSVRLLHVDGDEEQLLAALLFEASAASEEETLETVRGMPVDERAHALADLVGERGNRRHRPGRGFEALRYRFEVVSDYGAFRDLQRHRMLTVQWQALRPDLGAAVPEEVTAAGCGDLYAEALDRSRAEYERLAATGLESAAPYALCLGYRMRYVLDMNAREAMHLIELRSGREGHPSYRAVAHELHALIAERHPAVAAAMDHVDRSSEPRLERILSEMRSERRRAALSR